MLVGFRPRDARRVVKATRDAQTKSRKLSEEPSYFHRREMIVGKTASAISGSGGSGNVTAIDQSLSDRTTTAATQAVYNPYSSEVAANTIVVCCRDLWGIWWITGADCP